MPSPPKLTPELSTALQRYVAVYLDRTATDEQIDSVDQTLSRLLGGHSWEWKADRATPTTILFALKSGADPIYRVTIDSVEELS